MKTPLSFALFLMGFCLALLGGSLRADDWKTTDGKTYQNVSVVKAEPDAVTITHQDGGALVPLNTLPPDLQKRFNYDPATAKTAADTRAQASTKNAAALQSEMDQTVAKRQAELVATDPRHPTQPAAQPVATTVSPSPARPGPASPTTDASNDRHRAPAQTPEDIKKQALADAIKQLSSGDSTMTLSPDILASLQALANDPAQLAAALPADPSTDPQSVPTPPATAASPTFAAPATPVAQAPTSLVDDPNILDPARGLNMHSTSDLVDTTKRLKDDHSSDNHNTTSSLLRQSSNLGPNPNDPNHHSMDSLLNSDPLSNRQ